LKVSEPEVEFGGVTLVCEAYDAFEECDPDLVFANYKQDNALHKLLAKHHCPKLMDQLPVPSKYWKKEKQFFTRSQVHHQLANYGVT